MGKIRCYLVLQLWVYVWFPVCQANCPYQECSCNGPSIMCSALNLQEVPKLTSANGSQQWSLSIDGNNISRIPVGSLPPNLTEIFFDGNPITTIDDNAFDESAFTLTSLCFTDVRFTRFPDAFGHLHALSTLSIIGGNITDWNEDVWIIIGQTLQTLALQDVGITVWPSWIRHFTQLSNLTIFRGAVTSIPDGALDSVAHSLTSLSLNYNRLTMVPKALSNLNSLQMMCLQNNHIADIRWLPQNSKLHILSLSFNYIWNASQISEVLRPYNTSLNSFDIDNNHLTSIPNVSYLINVIALLFTSNRISDPISGDISSNVFILGLSFNSFPYVPKILSKLLTIKDIFLSNNAIRAISETDFHNEMVTIDLGYNLITELTDTSFPEMFGLADLELNNNPLTTISTVALQRLPRLTYLSLRYTRIKRLPLGLAYLSSLSTLDVTNSSSLVCTCMESSLTAWVVKLNSQNVLGNCGHTSVYDFFSLLSPSCPASAATFS